MVSNLKLHSQFEKILKDYRPNHDAINILDSIDLALLMGFSASGRNTLIKELLKTGKYNFIVSDTTRKPRINNGVKEEDGIEYNFRAESEVLRDLQNGSFLEAAIIHDQQVSGISIREIERVTEGKKIAIADVQTDGIESILKVKPDTKCIFVLPPNFEVWMKRLLVRGSLPEQELIRRLTSALDELDHIDVKNYAVIINDNLDESAKRLRSVVEDNQPLPYKDSKAEKVVLDLKHKITEFLQNN